MRNKFKYLLPALLIIGFAATANAAERVVVAEEIYSET